MNKIDQLESRISATGPTETIPIKSRLFTAHKKRLAESAIIVTPPMVVIPQGTQLTFQPMR